MTGSVIQQNLVPNQPTLPDVLEQFKKGLLLNLNCHHIATIQSFDPVTQRASATINYKKTFFLRDPVTGVYGPTTADYPILLDCPVFVLGGGPACLTFPIAKGDECMALFNDRDLDNWMAGSPGGALATPRLHSFSDAALLVGLRSLGNSIDGYDPSDVELRYGDNASVRLGASETVIAYGDVTMTLTSSGIELDGATLALKEGATEVHANGTEAAILYGSVKVGAEASGVSITNGTYTLKTLLTNLTIELKSLCTAIQAITVVTAGVTSGTPVNGTISIAPIGMAIDAIGTELGSLLV